jgi:hypothetical protein
MSMPLKDWWARRALHLVGELPCYEETTRLSRIYPSHRTTILPPRKARRTRTMALTMVVDGDLAEKLGQLRRK